jgi:hypothetical protein
MSPYLEYGETKVVQRMSNAVTPAGAYVLNGKDDFVTMLTLPEGFRRARIFECTANADGPVATLRRHRPMSGLETPDDPSSYKHATFPGTNHRLIWPGG